MSTLESELPAKEFHRVSRSAIVHLNRVKGIQTAAGYHHFAVLLDDNVFPSREVFDKSERVFALYVDTGKLCWLSLIGLWRRWTRLVYTLQLAFQN